MPLEASVHTDAIGNLTVQMVGSLDYENNIPLKQQLESLVEKNPLSNITLDMHFLDFVGSSGIGHFVALVNNLNKEKIRIFLANVKPEFIKVFKLFNVDEVEQVVRDLQRPGGEEKKYYPRADFKNSFGKD
ncbi:MAG: hypothetical protein DRQ88_11485 [Epsilonproteobacteria bacterium]|nr:MAG: hypothetical protein DRQ88_11485 [Campylobacterota bacterium]RLA64936.1 MAG: hypothetical protein DRQ89_02625 [Campylobacterota bacterium]